ncbi:hypothetical protein AIOL_003167 [Candidatus Rhodobacter oscarellae]|uniref:Uncharacterized protein n=1 Tax=Candidatus Rhodobacter oscarellae TaxID=1675527 RepID=A0A0J9E6A8_9RHOB|nr:hypothetical protein [Candidatus Rhodobacter lobularis]KMW58196.1 hypothetical protein AIOL_003167 [Candidatus Rhodobacter lobularis]
MLPNIVRAAVLIALWALPAASLAATDLPETAASRIHAKTCSHFANRARFQPRSPSATLEVLLAESCAQAYRSLYHQLDTSPYEARHAADYLDRMTAFKATVISINMDRMFGTTRTRRTQLKVPLGGTAGEASKTHPVTTAGEYLIARQMGVIGAYRAWADVVDFELAQD